MNYIKIIKLIAENIILPIGGLCLAFVGAAEGWENVKNELLNVSE